MTGRESFYGWKLVAVLFALDFLNMGFPFFGGAVINTYMLKQIPMARSTYGLGFSLLNLFVGLPSVLVAATILKWNAKTAFAVGSALIFLGALWLSLFASRPWHYLAAYGVVIGTGISFSTIVPITTVAARWFRRYRGRAMAIPLSASGAAGFVGAPFINKILTANGGNWRQAWLVVAGIVVASGIIAILFVKERPEDLGQSVDGVSESVGARTSALSSTGDATTEHPWSPAEAYRTRAYWMILLGGIACQFPYFFFVTHGILHLQSVGVDKGSRAWAVSFVAIGGIAGRLIGGWLIDKIAARGTFMLGLGCYLAGSLLAIEVQAGALPMALAAATLYGIAFGWTFVCLNAITARYYGPAPYPKLNGMMLLLTGVICSPAGFIGGKVFDKFGSYTEAFVLNMVLATIGILALSLATVPQARNVATPVPANG
jgi:MFS family permease